MFCNFRVQEGNKKWPKYLAPITHFGEQDEVSGSWLWHGPDLAINKQMEDFCLLSLPLK